MDCKGKHCVISPPWLEWLDYVKLSTLVSTSLQAVCKEWGGSGDITQPMMSSVGSKYVISVYALKNECRKMEDHHDCRVNVTSMFGLQVQLHI